MQTDKPNNGSFQRDHAGPCPNNGVSTRPGDLVLSKNQVDASLEQPLYDPKVKREIPTYVLVQKHA